MLHALDNCNWDMLTNLATFAGRQDGIGDRSERLLTGLTEAARASEFTTELAPLLTRASKEAANIITDAAQTVDTTPAPQPAPQPSTATRRARRIESSAAEAEVAALLADLRSEIRTYGEQHPGAVIEIDWHPVSQDDSA